MPIHNGYQKYFKFMSYQKFYKYLGMPNGYSDAMSVFIKILKPPFATLQKQGFTSVVFVDDSYFQGSTRGEHLENVHEIVSLLTSLGFSIHKVNFRTNKVDKVFRAYYKLCRHVC